MRPPIPLHGAKNRKVVEACDGCNEPYPVGVLIPIVDGSIKVCAACHTAATAMVLTSLERGNFPGGITYRKSPPSSSDMD